MKKVIALVIVILVLGVGVWWFLGNKSTGNASTATSISSPTTVEAKKGTVSVVVEGAATVEPYLQVTLRSPNTSILTWIARSGDWLSKGSPVAILDDAILRNNVAQTEVLLEQAEVEAQRATIVAERAAKDLKDKKILLENRALSPDQYSAAEEALKNAELALAAANLKVKQVRLTLEKARKDWEDAKIRAPFNGTVLKTFVSPGDLVTANSQIALFGDLSRVRFVAEVDEADIGKIDIGQTFTVSGDSLGEEPLRSKVDSISPVAEVVNNISIFQVSAIFPNTERKLRPGMSADFSILIKSDRGLVVPSKAISTVRGRSYIDVWENNEVVRKRVEKGADDGVNAVILQGIEEGAKVVVQGPKPAGSTAQPTASTSSTGEKSVLPITIPGAGGSK